MSCCGKVNYSNLSRYSPLNEKTFRRWFQKVLPFTYINQLGNQHVIPQTACVIAALDCSFIRKSGSKTYGLAKFWNAKQGKAEQGLEISTLAVVDVDYNTAYHVSTRQTEPDQIKGKTRVDAYAQHFKEDCQFLPKSVRYVVTDAYYSKSSITNAICEMNFHQIGKMRCDANLRYLYTGEQKPRGRKKRYDGKVQIGDVKRLTLVEHQDGVDIYTIVVNSVNLERDVRIVYLVQQLAQNTRFAILFSTDTTLDALSIYRYYQARFQIEFLFRDAKQFTGLCDSQARAKQALDNHFNASFTALNVMKWLDRENSPKRTAISILNWKRHFFNALFMERIFSNFGFDLSSVKCSDSYRSLCDFGKVL